MSMCLKPGSTSLILVKISLENNFLKFQKTPLARGEYSKKLKVIIVISSDIFLLLE